jgi:hypothetical protein
MGFELIDFFPVVVNNVIQGDWQAQVQLGWGPFKRYHLYRGSATTWTRYYPTQVGVKLRATPFGDPARGDIRMFLSAAWAARKWKIFDG